MNRDELYPGQMGPPSLPASETLRDAEIRDLRERLAEAERERDERKWMEDGGTWEDRAKAAEAKAAQFEQDWVAAKYEFGEASKKIHARALAAESALAEARADEVRQAAKWAVEVVNRKAAEAQRDRAVALAKEIQAYWAEHDAEEIGTTEWCVFMDNARMLTEAALAALLREGTP